MKEIKAIVQPFQLAAIVTALEEIPDLPGITVFEVHGFGRRRAQGAKDSLEDESILYAKKMQLELVVPDRLVELVVGTIRERARTGAPGDGKIFIHSLDDALRIRTGERGEAAL
jgi:nitrogen regulatory protein P-II 1